MVCLSAVRIYFVNKNVNIPPETSYKKGETVKYGEDSYNGMQAVTKGYALRVDDAVFLSEKEYYDTYHYELAETVGECYYCVVKLTVSNIDAEQSEESGINLYDLPLISKRDYCLLSEEAYYLMNPNMPQSLGFSLKKGTEKQIIVTYLLNKEMYSSMKKINKEGFKILMTTTPNRKTLSLK